VYIRGDFGESWSVWGNWGGGERVLRQFFPFSLFFFTNFWHFFGFSQIHPPEKFRHGASPCCHNFYPPLQFVLNHISVYFFLVIVGL